MAHSNTHDVPHQEGFPIMVGTIKDPKPAVNVKRVPKTDDLGQPMHIFKHSCDREYLPHKTAHALANICVPGGWCMKCQALVCNLMTMVTP